MVKSVNWIETGYGNIFDYENFGPDDFCIEDIAGALSKLPRFLGHIPEPYSVAQHCCLVADLVPDEFKLEALLHDAPEAYLGDLPTPLKRLPQLRGYCELEQRIWEAMAERWRLPKALSRQVKAADWEAFKWEWYALKVDPDVIVEPSKMWEQWGMQPPPLDITVKLYIMSPGDAQEEYEKRFDDYYNKHLERLDAARTKDVGDSGSTGILTADAFRDYERRRMEDGN